MSEQVEQAARLLRRGEVVGIPTETVYGLAGNGFDLQAVSRIFAIKNRPRFDPLILHTDSLEKIESWVGTLPDTARRLADAFWPGPLTLVVPTSARIPDLVTSGLPAVAFRIPAHPLTQKLLQQLDFPLAAPSANPFGYISPTSAQHVRDQLGNKVSLVLDGGTCTVGVESTIVATRDSEERRVLRLGGLSLEKLEAVVGKLEVQTHSSSNPAAPGMLKSHYAPRKKLILGDPVDLLREYEPQRTGVLLFQNTELPCSPAVLRILSPQGDTEEAARHLFAYLRELDAAAIDRILAEPLPETGLGRAINDRLRRASV